METREHTACSVCTTGPDTAHEALILRTLDLQTSCASASGAHEIQRFCELKSCSGGKRCEIRQLAVAGRLRFLGVDFAVPRTGRPHYAAQTLSVPELLN
eukprot:2092581-Rhodomonas_salina.3